jgi:hypothetical protein
MVMAGPRGSYKSFKALNWAMRATQVGPVYVVSAEGGDFERRAAAWMMHHDITVAPSLYVVEKRLDLNTRAGVDLIRQDCVRLGHGRPENYCATASALARWATCCWPPAPMACAPCCSAISPPRLKPSCASALPVPNCNVTTTVWAIG